MSKQENVKKYSAVKLIGEFSRYYKPHMGLFVLTSVALF